MRFLSCLAVTLAVAVPASAGGQYFEVAYAPSDKPGELQFGVTYTIWIPDGVKTVRGVIVHQHGCGSGACKGGATAAYDLHWQALAKKWDCALLGPSYQQEDKQNCRLWCDPRNGSAKTFLRALHDLAVKAGHAEIETAPWCLWGHSGGGFWASIMQTMYPDRIVAIWLRSGTAFAAWQKGEIAKVEIPEAAYGIPIALNPGFKEKGDKRFSSAWTGATAMFTAYREKDAPAVFVPDPRTGHECGDSRYFAIRWFDAWLKERLPDSGTTLKPVDRKRLMKVEVVTAEDKVPASVLPSSAIGISMWFVEYTRTGAVGDKTPPPAPHHVKTKAVEQATEVTWEAEADLESGIQQFVILKDGVEIGRVPEKPIGKFGRPLFQSMSYHDTPEAPVPALKFVDKGKAGKYQIIAINSVGLKSEPSK